MSGVASCALFSPCQVLHRVLSSLDVRASGASCSSRFHLLGLLAPASLLAQNHKARTCSLISILLSISALLYSIGIITSLRHRSSCSKKYARMTSRSTLFVQNYKAYTSVLIPIPPAIYETIPSIFKTTLLCEWPIYNQVQETAEQKIPYDRID